MSHFLRDGQTVGDHQRATGGRRARPWGDSGIRGTRQGRGRRSPDSNSAPRDPRIGACEDAFVVPTGAFGRQWDTYVRDRLTTTSG